MRQPAGSLGLLFKDYGGKSLFSPTVCEAASKPNCCWKSSYSYEWPHPQDEADIVNGTEETQAFDNFI